MKKIIAMFVAWVIATCLCFAQVQNSLDGVETIPAHTEADLQVLGIYKLWHGVCLLQDGERFTLDVCDRGDSIVNGLAYGKIEIKGRKDALFLARQEGDKVYRYDEKGNTDVLMLDYSLNVGDEVIVDGDRKMRVVETGIVQKNVGVNSQKKLKKLRLIGEGGKEDEDIWIEGVGSVYTGVLSKKQIENCDEMLMASVSFGAEDSYVSFKINTDFYKTTSVESFDLTDEEKETLKEKELYGQEFLEFDFIGNTLHVTGVLDLSCYNYQMECMIRNGDIECHLYELTLIDEYECRHYQRIEAEFPDFKNGIYQVNYNGGKPVEVVCEVAQENPFIENGKTWHVRFYSHRQVWLQTYGEGPYEEYDLYFGADGSDDVKMGDESVKADTVIAGKGYRKLYIGNGEKQSVASLLREEDGKVFRWSTKDERDWLLYDFTLQEGDTFFLSGNGEEEYFTCNVVKVDVLDIDGHPLKRIVFEAKSRGEEQEDWSVSTNVWIEGIGCLNGNPLNNVVDASLTGGGMDLCPYVYTATDFFSVPFDFQGIRGRELVVGEDVTDELPAEKWGVDSLHYELLANENKEGHQSDTLHVSGYMWMDSAPHHYIYCYNDFNVNSTITFERVSVGSASAGMRAYRVDLKFLAFYEDEHYTVVDSEGKYSLPRITASVSGVVPPTPTIRETFDMNGRPVSIPSKGIYIRNGKKVFVP